MLEESNFNLLVVETEGSSSYYDILAYLSGRYELINSYGNTFLPSRQTISRHPFFLSPTLMNCTLALSPFLSLAENSLSKGAIILAIAEKK